MSDSRRTERPPSSECGNPAHETRVDPAHAAAKQGAKQGTKQGVKQKTPQLAQAVATATKADSSTEELRIQADQLAEYLRSRQRDLDHRESLMNAHLARLDDEHRGERLRTNEQQNDLARREREVEDRFARLVEVEAASEQSLRAREEALSLRESLVQQTEEQASERSKLADDEKTTSLDFVSKGGLAPSRSERNSGDKRYREVPVPLLKQSLDPMEFEQKEEQLKCREEAIAHREKQLLDAFEQRRQMAEEEFTRRKKEFENTKAQSFWEDEFHVSISKTTELDNVAALHHRKQELIALAKELSQRANSLDTAQKAFQELKLQSDQERMCLKKQIATREEAIEQSHQQILANLERYRQSSEEELEWLRIEAQTPSPELLAREKAVEEQTQLLDERKKQLDETEKKLDDNQIEAERLQHELIEQRQQAREMARVERQRIALEQRQSLKELDAKRQSLMRRSEHVDQCRISLNQLRSDLSHMHRETLEIRLATEEIWIQLSGSAPPASLTQSLGRIRTKLAEHYQTANAQLAEQREELNAVRVELSKQHEGLVTKKREWERWIEQRQEEIEEQTERLVAREQELQCQEDEFNELAR